MNIKNSIKFFSFFLGTLPFFITAITNHHLLNANNSRDTMYRKKSNTKKHKAPNRPRKHRLNPSTSIIVPCVAKHFKYIPELLDAYVHQTETPNEFVISLSNAQDVQRQDLLAIEQQPWPFTLKIIKNNSKKSAGENRNIAIDNSTGDIILCQDADDIPHPQRVEIVRFIFSQYHVDHLMHSYMREAQQPITYDKNAITILSPTSHHNAMNSNIDLSNGEVCYNRRVANLIKYGASYQAGEDIEFNQAVYRSFKNTAIIATNLMHYKNELSSFRMLLKLLHRALFLS